MMLDTLRNIQKNCVNDYDKAPFFIKHYACKIIPISFSITNAIPGFVSGASRALDELSIGIITRNSNSFKNSVIHVISAVADLFVMPYYGVRSVFTSNATDESQEKTYSKIEKYCDYEDLELKVGVQNPVTPRILIMPLLEE